MVGDKVTGAFPNIVITDSEGALGPIQDTFGNVDPVTEGGCPQELLGQ